jgi:1-acyl-sn-glycerol-3-phosphate acyltransferase
VLALCARLWARTLLFAAGVRLTIEGLDVIAGEGGPYFFVGNHQSALDIPVLMVALRGDVRFMAKKSLFYVPIFGWALWRHGYVPIDRAHVRASMQALERMLERLKRRAISFVVFPEGTRSRDGRLLPFRKGAMKICARSGMSVVPFGIEGTLAVHYPKALRLQPGPVRLALGRPIPAEEVAAMSVSQLHDRVRRQIARLRGRPEDEVGGDGAALTSAEGIRV